MFASWESIQIMTVHLMEWRIWNYWFPFSLVLALGTIRY